MAAPKLSTLATLVDHGGRWVTIDAGYAGHFDLHYNEQIPAEIAALAEKRDALRVTVESAEASEQAKRLLTFLIERSRAEGAAAERARCAEILAGGRAEIDRYAKLVDDAKAALGVDHGEPLVDSCRRIAAERARQQPRDLAGRIRALVQEYAGRWATETRVGVADELHEVMDMLRVVLHRGSKTQTAEACADEMRARAGQRKYAPSGEVLSRAADELEAIVRECKEKRT